MTRNTRRPSTHWYGFVPMVGVIPEGVAGDARVEHFEISASEASFANVMNQFRALEMVKPGRYCRLRINGGVMMSDTQFEQHTNYDAVQGARGDVVVGGLGLGMIILPMLLKPTVQSITIIEKSADVIELVAPAIVRWMRRKKVGARVHVKHVGVHEYRPDRTGRQFDFVYHDIWPHICVDDIEERKALHLRYRRWLRKGGKVTSWQYDHLCELRRAGRWR